MIDPNECFSKKMNAKILNLIEFKKLITKNTYILSISYFNKLLLSFDYNKFEKWQKQKRFMFVKIVA